MSDLNLRRGAVLGWLFTFLYRGYQLTAAQRGAFFGELLAFGLILAITAASCLPLMPRSLDRLRRHVDLFVPFGWLVGIELILDLLTVHTFLGGILKPAANLKLLTITLDVSFRFLIGIVLNVIFAGWTTALVVQAVREDRTAPAEALSTNGDWFGAVLAAEALGWGVIMLGIGALLFVSFLGPLFLLLIAIVSIGWNLRTTALLIAAVVETGGWKDRLRRGLALSRENRQRWWALVLVQVLLLGGVTMMYVSSSGRQPNGQFYSTQRSDFSVNGFWVGGYENNCRWYSKWYKLADRNGSPPVLFLLETLFVAVAIGIKTRFAEDLLKPADPA